jgi:hypothetical protein
VPAPLIRVRSLFSVVSRGDAENAEESKMVLPASQQPELMSAIRHHARAPATILINRTIPLKRQPGDPDGPRVLRSDATGVWRDFAKALARLPDCLTEKCGLHRKSHALTLLLQNRLVSSR